MPCLRVICATVTPASPSFRIATICDSVNRDFFIRTSGEISCQKNTAVAVYQKGELTQALITELAVEAFDIGILIRLPWSDKRQLDIRAVSPRIEYLAFELRAMIDGDRLRQSAGLGQSIQHGLHPRPRERGIDLDRHALPGAVVHNVEAATPSPGSQPVREKIHRPTQVRRPRLRQRFSLDQTDTLTLAPAHRQSGVAVDSIDALAVDRPTFAPQSQIHPAIAVSTAER